MTAYRFPAAGYLLDIDYPDRSPNPQREPFWWLLTHCLTGSTWLGGRAAP
jgi:hypothetical protein